MSDMPMPKPGADKNVTKTDINKNKLNSKGKPPNVADIKGNIKKTLEGTDWKEVVGPYPVVSPGTREASFVHAISSAGVAHAVTRSCSSGELENCGCDRSLRGMSPEGFQVRRGPSNGGIKSRLLIALLLSGQHSSMCLFTFQWSGCSDNVDFGVTFSRTFVDAQDRRKSRKKPRNPTSLMNLHNNEAGRKVIITIL